MSRHGRRTTPTPIAHEELQQLLDEEGAQLVDVLPPAEYEDAHIAGAINISLRTLDRETTAVLDGARSVVVHSPRSET